jgi:Domain of unknown function (DUF5666)
MKKSLLRHMRLLVGTICGLCMIVLFTACAGVSTTTNANGTKTTSLTGSVQSVNAGMHSVVLNIGGQQVTVSGLTDQEVATLQGQTGRSFTMQVTPNGTNDYTINSGTNPQEDDAATPEANNNNEPQNQNVGEPQSIDFIGRVRSANANNVVVSMPGGDTLTLGINALTDRSDLINGSINAGQQLKVKALANANGSFTATKLEALQSDDLADQVKLQSVDFAGVTTQAVGSDNVVHFKVGNKSYSYTISSTTELKDFTNAQTIGANQQIKLEVLFNGTRGAVTKVENANN